MIQSEETSSVSAEHNTIPDALLSERIATVFEATGSAAWGDGKSEEDSFWRNIPPGLSSFAADIYFHYKLDKPQHFLLKAVRQKLLWPLWKRQVQYNQALRSAVVHLWQERTQMRRDLDAAERRLAKLEKTVASLSAKGRHN